MNNKTIKNKLNKCIVLLLIFSILLTQMPVFAIVGDAGNIAPSASSLSLSKQRKVTVQVDKGVYSQSLETVQNKGYSILKPKLEEQNIEVDIRFRVISSIDTVSDSTSFSDDSENFYVSLNNSSYTEFTDGTKSAKILNLFVEKQVTFIGVGTDTNKSQIEAFILKNQNNGMFIDNSNLDAALSRVADYIIGRASVSLDLLVGDGFNQDKDLIQNKINTIVRPKLASANVDVNINVKMQKFAGFNTRYKIFNKTLYAYKNEQWVPLYTSNKFTQWYTTYSISYDGKMYFKQYTSDYSTMKMCYYDFYLNTIVDCIGTEGVGCFTPASDGRLYWTKTYTFIRNLPNGRGTEVTNYQYSKVYAYDPITDTNTYVTETHNEAVAYGTTLVCTRIISSLAVSLDLKLVYTFSYGSSTSSVGDGIACYDAKNKQVILSGDFTDYFYPGLVILSDNSVVYSIKSTTNNNTKGCITFRTPITELYNNYGRSGQVVYEFSGLTGLNEYPSALNIFGNGQSLYLGGYKVTFTPNVYYRPSTESILKTDYDFLQLAKQNIYVYTITGSKAYSVTWTEPYVQGIRGLEYFAGPWILSNGDVLFDENHNYWSIPSYPNTDKPYIKTINENLQATTFDDAKDSYLAYLGDTALPELNDYTKKASIVSSLKSNNVKFVGLGTQTNQTQFNDLVALNNNKGAVYDNTNLDTAMNNLADYIISNTKKSSQSLTSYIVVSDENEIIESQDGTLDTNGLPSYSSTSTRSKDYFDVTGNNSYSFNSSEPISNFKIYYYDSMLNLISSSSYNSAPSNIITPESAVYAKISYTNKDSNTQVTVINNTEASGENIAYSSNVNDYEKDSVDYLYRFNHDPYKIAGVKIDNPTGKIVFNNADISIPIKRFSKPGTYTISLTAKDMPKIASNATNMLSNGDAETIDSQGNITNWGTWSASDSITKFTRRTTSEYKLYGTGSFEISTDSKTDGTNNSACYYQDIDISPNTSYTLKGLIGAQNCNGSFVVYELDTKYNIIKSMHSNEILSNTIPSDSILTFTTGVNTAKLRVFILKGKTVRAGTALKDYLFADNIVLIRNTADSRFNEYRKTSSQVQATVYAHRLPKADFSYKIYSYYGTFRIQNLEDNGLSYDPDHTSMSNKGILDSKWKWAEIAPNGTTTWHDGKISPTMQFSKGTEILLWYKVRDTDGIGGLGAWSKPKMQRIDGSLANPVAMFVPNPNPLPMQNEIELADQSYSRNVNGVITKRVWTIRKAGETTVKTLTFDREDNVNNKYYKHFTSIGFGKYTITLTVTDSYGMVSKPYSRTINVIDTIDPTISVDKSEGEFKDGNGANIKVTCKDSTQATIYNRGLKTINYVWSKSAAEPLISDDVQTITIPTEKTYTKEFETSQKEDGTWYLYIKDIDYAGNSNNNGDYVKFGPYKIETLKAGHFYITMMLDIGWRAYFFDLNNGIDDNHDGQIDRYPRRANTDIGTLKMPINYYGLVGHDRTYIKAGYKVKGKIDIIGNPDYAEFNINYIKNGITYTDIVPLSKSTGDTYIFEWVIPLETDSKSFVSFDLVTKKGNKTYGNEKWVDDTWDARNTSRLVFYVKGKATDDLTYVQSQ